MFKASLGDDGAELRPLEPWQVEEFLAHIERGRHYIGRYIGLPDAAGDIASARAFLQAYADKAAADTGRLYGIWLGSTLVGGVLFRTMDVVDGNCEVGCWLEPSAVGRGLVSRAAATIIDWALETRGLNRVEWHVSSTNQASIKVAQRLGMTYEGTQRQNYPYRGIRHDTEIWSVLAPEWRKNRASGDA
ncbi:GNAT family N-acetyltransferase [Streptomyces sp. NPDC057271]|uniref:GNAT family N-acetyltransferase n=1 Tax=unclassified Streptomyces TaxID=2593676 RepID=UPI0036372707